MNYRDQFKKGTVEMMVLALLMEEDMYGYQLSQLISERSGNAIAVPEGSLYPTLYLLVDQGCITDKKVQIGKRMTRVYYHLELTGLLRLREMYAEYQTFTDGLHSLLSGFAQSMEEKIS